MFGLHGELKLDASRIGDDAIRAGWITPQSVAVAFKVRYDHQAVLKRYLDLLAEINSQ